MTADRTPTSAGPRTEAHRDYAGRTCATGLLHSHEAAASPEERGGGAEPDHDMRGEWRQRLAPDALALFEELTSLRLQNRRLLGRIHRLEATTPAAPSEPAPLNVERLASVLPEDAVAPYTDWTRETLSRHIKREYARLQSTPTPTEEPT